MKHAVRTRLLVVTCFLLPGLLLAGKSIHDETEHEPAEITPPEITPAEVTIGERLFLEARFAHAFYANPGMADPTLAHTQTTTGRLVGPFAGRTMNCRACHMVDEHAQTANMQGAGMRTYADYASRSPVPGREDGIKAAGRNAMSMVNIAIPRAQGVLFHFDGEFNSLEDLVRGTFSGRNFGWLPGEEATAMKHLARVIREDDGSNALGQEFGGSYEKILTGTAQDIPTEFRLPQEYRVNVKAASDRQIFDAVAKLVAAYVRDLGFSRDDEGQYDGSPYDHFLQRNHLPRKPKNGESPAAYGQRLLRLVESLDRPRFISTKDGAFETHDQPFVFGPEELAGMKLFFRPGSSDIPGGNCVACHNAPHFSDFSFHNSGLTQFNYDKLHGEGAFNKLRIPGLQQRNAEHERYLPATAQHPEAVEPFRRPPAKDKPGQTDLGLWNVYANPDLPGPQKKLQGILCQQAKSQQRGDCTQETLLPLGIAAFKTPVLRNLGHSSPYMHTGQFAELREAVTMYLSSSALARQAGLRNGDPALRNIHLSAADVASLVAFLKALNEDYD